jgi:hypothetical protein
MWHFYAGNALNVYYIDIEENMQIIKLGNNPENGEVFQAVVLREFGLVANQLSKTLILWLVVRFLQVSILQILKCPTDKHLYRNFHSMKPLSKCLHMIDLTTF